MYQIFSKTHSLRSLMNVGGPLVLSYTSKKSTYELIRFISKSKKCYFWGRFGTFCGSPDPSGLFFSKNGLPYFSHFITSYKKSEKTDGLLLGSWVTNGGTNLGMTGLTNRDVFMGHYHYRGCSIIIYLNAKFWIPSSTFYRHLKILSCHMMSQLSGL